MKSITYGIGGFCEFCDETHNHPLNNIVERVDTDDDELVEEVTASTLE